MNRPKTEIIIKTGKAVPLNKIQVRNKMEQYKTKHNMLHGII